MDLSKRVDSITVYKKIDFLVYSIGSPFSSIRMSASDSLPSNVETPFGTDVPSEFLCPITYEIMTDPVTLSDGHTYERQAIEHWLQTHATSPLSNSRVSLTDLKPNYALRSAIERFSAAHPANAIRSLSTVPVARSFRARTDGEHVFVECVESEPLDVVTILVNDVSGSMGSPSTRAGTSEGSLFSRLDLVKHANRTVAAMHAGEDASLGIITFSSTAATVLPVKKMDTTGLADANRAITSMTMEGSTNMWAGLQEALKQATIVAKAKPNSFINIIFLTDGEPTSDYLPRLGLTEALRRRLAELKMNLTINCFGFGYSLDAKLLQELCSVGGGIYGYLPDCSMVGSVSINAAAAALSTVVADVRINETVVGNIQAGATRSIKMHGIPSGSQLEVSYANGGKASVTVGEATHAESSAAKIIFKLTELLLEASKSREFHSESQALVETMLGWIGDECQDANAFASAVKQDIKDADDNKGQLLKALKTPEWYKSWGLNHIISYTRALSLQQCVNFKDAALQHFAGDLFRHIQDKGNDLFDNLPAPRPSCSYYGSGGSAAAAGGAAGGGAVPTNMAGFNTASGGCWMGWCKIQMDDGTWKLTHQLVRGDVVRGGHRIACVVRTRLVGPMPMMVGESLAITPWHPVRLALANMSEWVFPCQEAAALGLRETNEFCHYIYNLVLESGHYVRIGNYDVCTLGHYFQDNDVIRHPYFGTGRVIRDVMAKDGWVNGLVTLDLMHQYRDHDGLVSRI
jgi:Mg-chelatase subunit ChlD